MKRKILEPKDYKKLLGIMDKAVLLASCGVVIVVIWFSVAILGFHWPASWLLRAVAYFSVLLLLSFLWLAAFFALMLLCNWIFEKFFVRMCWPVFSSEVYKGAGEARKFIHIALRTGGGLRFLARRVAELDMTSVASEEKFAFLGGQVAQGGCCLICDDGEHTAEVLRQAGARQLEGGAFELGKAADMQYLYKELLYEGAWEMLCGVDVSFPRFPRACSFLSHPEEMDITRIVNHAKLLICSGPDDAYWWLCWDNGETSKRNHQAFVLKWPPDEWYMEHSTQEYGVFSFITKAVDADKVAAVHEISGRRKDWRMYGLASRDWAQLARRAEKSGEVFFSLRAPAGQVLQAWRGNGGYVEVNEAEETHALSGDAGFSAMLDAIMPEGGCVLSCSHDAEYVYVWAREGEGGAI